MNGCKIEGRVENSVLSPGVTVRKGATVKNSIIFNNTYIDENSHLDTVIIDKKVYIGKNCLIGHGDDLTPNKEKPELLENGISVIGRSTIIPEGAVVERNVRICTRAKIDDKNKLIKSGETLRR